MVKTDDLETEELLKLTRGLSKFCVLSAKGYPVINKLEGFEPSGRDKIHLALSARYLANRFQVLEEEDTTIDSTMTNNEISDTLRIKLQIVNARISDLRKDGKIEDVGKARYQVLPHTIEPLIKEMEKQTRR